MAKKKTCELCKAIKNAREAYRRAILSQDRARIMRAIKREEDALYLAGQLTDQQTRHPH